MRLGPAIMVTFIGIGLVGLVSVLHVGLIDADLFLPVVDIAIVIFDVFLFLADLTFLLPFLQLLLMSPLLNLPIEFFLHHPPFPL